MLSIAWGWGWLVAVRCSLVGCPNPRDFGTFGGKTGFSSTEFCDKARFGADDIGLPFEPCFDFDLEGTANIFCCCVGRSL